METRTKLIWASLLVAGIAAACSPTANRGAGPAGGGAGLNGGESALGSYLAGRSARFGRDTAAAADYFDLALEEDPENQTLLQRTFMLMLEEGRMERAVELAELRTETNPRAVMAQMVLAIDDIRDGRLDVGEQRLDQPQRTGFAVLLRPLLLAWLAAGKDDVEAAMASLDGLSDRAAFAAFKSYHSALIYDYLDRPAEAEAAYIETRGGGAANATRVVLAYGSFLHRQDRADEARTLFEDYLTRVPENPVIEAALADIEAGRGVNPPVQTIEHGIAEAFYGAAGALARDRAGNAAKVYVQLALYMRPDLDSGHMLLGEIFENDERWEEAIAVYEAIQRSSAYSWDSRLRTATSLNRLDRVDDAVELLRSMVDERPADTGAPIALADILRTHERYEEAAVEYDRAIERTGDLQERHWALLYTRGIARERSSDWDLAEADFLRALELRPDQPLVLNYLGYSWVERAKNLDEARSMIEKAVEQRPNDGYIVDSLGWVLFRMGEFDAAVKHLERAVELRPEDPTINEHLGDAYWQVGRRLEARFQWRHALALEPDEKQVPIIKNKLDDGLQPVKPVGSDS